MLFAHLENHDGPILIIEILSFVKFEVLKNSCCWIPINIDPNISGLHHACEYSSLCYFSP